MFARLLFVRLPLLLVLGLAALSPANAAPPSPPLLIQGLGPATVPLAGPWRFHLGDDPTWASPTLDDSTWETIATDKPWGLQGHFAYTGFAWYRIHLDLRPIPGTSPELSVFIPHVDDAYEVFWNGGPIGHLGRLPPHPLWYFHVPPQFYKLGPPQPGVLALRVWKAPAISYDTGESGGLLRVPLLGTSKAIAEHRGSLDYVSLKGRQYSFLLDTVYFLIGAFSLLTWASHRNRMVLLWMSIFTSGPLLLLILSDLRLPISFGLALGLQQPTFALEDISLWFLLLYLLQLETHPRLMRWTRNLAWIELTVAILDGLLNFVDWSAGHTALLQIVDAILTAPVTLIGFFPLILIPFAFGKRLGASRWLVAFFALLTQMITGLRITAQQGERFTHWTFSQRISQPLFTIDTVPFNALLIASTLLFFSIVYAVYRYSVDESQRQAAVEQEFKSAQELQRVLIPDTLPSLPGYAVTSAYRPAQEVGGDFFQVIAQPGGSALLLVGDVSGKGLKAAMTVSLIVGAVRTLAELFHDPADILAHLNRRLQTRLADGFVTCLVLTLDPEGHCVLATAGHPSPFLNRNPPSRDPGLANTGRETAAPGGSRFLTREIILPPALPLGILPDATFERTTLTLAIGDRLTLYTDGLLEARSPEGDLFGFDRLANLIANRPDAREAVEAAVSFGQDDDITVLTITRLATGVPSTTHLLAPTLLTPKA